MSSKTVLIRTDADGDFLYTRSLFALVRGIQVDIGTLETPDILIEDGVSGTTILDLEAAAASSYHVLGVALVDADGVTIEGGYGPPIIFGSLVVTVAGGGDSKTGTLRFLLET